MDTRLIACIECGKPLHQAADRCPGCGTGTPQGLRCRICGINDRAANVAVMRMSRYGEPDSGYTAVAHIACMRGLGLPSQCAACSAALDDSDVRKFFAEIQFGSLGWGVSSSEMNRCPECRAPNPLAIAASCNVCWTPINAHGIVRKSNMTFHQECLSKRPAEALGCLTLLLPFR